MNTDSAFDGTVLARIDEIIEDAVKEGQAPGVVAAVACGDRVHVATAGVTAVGGDPMRRNTLFRISSNTKPITAALVLSLADAGVLDLDGPVDDLLPELAHRRVLMGPDGPLADTVPGRRFPMSSRSACSVRWAWTTPRFSRPIPIASPRRIRGRWAGWR